MKDIRSELCGLTFIAFIALACSCTRPVSKGPVRLLILSGRNNHEWRRTTPVLTRMFLNSKKFTAEVTEEPDTLTFSRLQNYDVVVSNWNSWPDSNFRFPERWEKDFSRWVRNGGGTIFIHAGASSFYGWDEYHRIGIGRWGKETKHGEPTKARISEFDQVNPVTKGFRDFYIVDEIWENTDIISGAQALATVTATDTKDGHAIKENAVFVTRTGRGRSFYTTLGHDERALLNSGLETLILRAAQWVAHRKVTFEPPADIRATMTFVGENLNWEQSDTTFGLNNGSDRIWQFNFNNRFGKPYFHPLSVKKSVLTCLSPPDHPWHLGFWFSWKYINGVNYWEYLDNFKSDETGYRSAGITETVKKELIRNADFSADIRLELSYHPADSASVLKEIRNVHISPPERNGGYFIDHESLFYPLKGDVLLDRTPTEGEPEGKSWGGYAGLSLRFSQDYTSPEVIAPDDSDKYKKSNWVYMGFNTLGGDTAGACMMKDPRFSTAATSWYVISDPLIPFFYLSPAVLFDGKILLKKGTELHLKYRTWFLPGKTAREELQKIYNEYTR